MIALLTSVLRHFCSKLLLLSITAACSVSVFLREGQAIELIGVGRSPHKGVVDFAARLGAGSWLGCTQAEQLFDSEYSRRTSVPANFASAGARSNFRDDPCKFCICCCSIRARSLPATNCNRRSGRQTLSLTSNKACTTR